VGIFLLAFYGLGYSVFPWLVVDRIDAVAGGERDPSRCGSSSRGVVVVLPVIIGYTVFAYRVFSGGPGHDPSNHPRTGGAASPQ
jgi:cytochrome d ubiquinol oxidase subunit II